jgi:hypothetical protein
MTVAAYQAQLAFDGVFSAQDAADVIAFARSIGAITAEEEAARLKALELMSILDALNGRVVSAEIRLMINQMVAGGASQANVNQALIGTGVYSPGYSAPPSSGYTVPAASSGGGNSGAYWIPDPANPGRYIVNPNAGRANGGPLTGVNEVGEQGTEGIINGVVIPHGKWERMKRSGLVPGRHFFSGGPIQGPTNIPDMVQGITDAQAQAIKMNAVKPNKFGNGNVVVDSGSGAYIIQAPPTVNGTDSSQSSSSAVVAAVAQAESSTASVAAAAETISESGKQTTAATEKNTAQNNQGNQAIIAKLTSIEAMLAQNFQAMPKQWAAAAARTV